MNAKIVASRSFRSSRASPPARPHWVTHFSVATANEILVRLRTSDGVEGLGPPRAMLSAEPVVRAFRAGVAEQIPRHGPAGARAVAREDARADLGAAGSRKRLESGSSHPHRRRGRHHLVGTSSVNWPHLPLHRLFGVIPRSRALPRHLRILPRRQGPHRIAR